MKNKESKLRIQLKDAAQKVLSNQSSGANVNIKFYENGTDELLIIKTLDSFLEELVEAMGTDNNSKNNKS